MKRGLKNPAVIAAVANSPQGKKAIGDALDTANKTTAVSLSIIKNIFWFSIVAGTGYWGYKKFVNRFSSLNYDLRYTPATISSTVAKAKADAIHKAMYGFGNGFNTVSKNLKGLSHNDFIKVYNEFGGRKGLNDIFQRMNMFEWFADQFDGSEIMRLRFIVPNFF
ncbi:hypothetical protein [Flavobacterium sp.]|uniref:hypothetical protein n=1 Tax=Flavobacterium sp. TaxID=239 RepID=UPI0037524BD9